MGYKKGYRLSPQEYDKEITVQYKNRKETLPKITPPAMMELCAIRDEYTDDTSPVVMKDCLNKNLDEILRDITYNETEKNRYSMKMVIKKCPDDQDDDQKEKKAENKNEGVIQKYITNNYRETNQDTVNKVI